MELFQSALIQIVDIAMLFFEFVGVFVLIATGMRGAYDLFRRSKLTKLNLAKGMALGLEFKLGSEILRTVVVRDLSEIYIVAGIVLLRAALTFLINWEIKNEEAHYQDDSNSERSI
jgi:uncharacterized membrane protein